MEIKLEKEKLVLKFDYNPELIKFVKTLRGYNYNPKNTTWSVALCRENIQKLKDNGYTGIEPLLNQISENKKLISKLKIKRTLKKFQLEGVEKMLGMGGNVLLADDMGLGKTIQAIAYSSLHDSLMPCLVVCPSYLSDNWKREILSTLDDVEVVQLEGKSTYEIKINKNTFVIIGYSVIQDWVEELKKIKFGLLVLDEAHYIKNSKAKRTKAVKQIATHIKKVNNDLLKPRIIALTGTPIPNYVYEIYSILYVLNKNIFPNYMYFLKRYCDAWHNGFGWEYKGSSNTKELFDILNNNLMIRRIKKDVLTELPPKIYSEIFVDIDNKREYKKALDNFSLWLKENNKALIHEKIAQIEYLRQVAVRGKIDKLKSFIEDKLSETNKLVVFGHHREFLNELYEYFKDISVLVTGNISGTERTNAVDKFQNDNKVKLFLGSIKACGTGITLTASSTVIFFEVDWTPGVMAQAEDRVHRIGQNSGVNIYYFIAKDTVEEYIYTKVLKGKTETINKVVDGKVSANAIDEIINMFKK